MYIPRLQRALYFVIYTWMGFWVYLTEKSGQKKYAEHDGDIKILAKLNNVLSHEW